MRYPVVVGVLVCVVTAFILLRARDPVVTNYPAHGGTIVAFGDSLVEGVGTTPGHTFVDLLSARIGEPIVNLGVSGDTTADGVARIAQVLAEEPRIVIVLLGGNDALHKVEPTQTVANMRTIIERINDAGAAVLLVAPPGGLYFSRTYEREYERLARTYGLAYVPNILQGFLGQPTLMADTIHPNDAGHVRMADRIEPPLRVLMRNTP